MSYYNYPAQNQQHHTNQQPQDNYFDPYANFPPSQSEPYPSYDQSGYRDDYYPEPARPAGGFDGNGEKDLPFNAATVQVKARSNPSMRRYRYEQGRIWTRGGGWRTFGRFLCCTLLIGVWMVVGIVLALVLYVRPPNVIIGAAVLPTSNQVGSISGGGISINVDIPITVNNPSYLDVTLPEINAKIYYPINDTFIGNGTLRDTSLPSNTNKSFFFPFSLDYTSSLDTSGQILKDISSRCSNNQDLTVKYDLTVGVRALGVTISPSVSNNISFACPSALASALSSGSGSGLNIGSIINGLGGSS